MLILSKVFMQKDKQYFKILDRLKLKIRQAQIKAALSVNAQMLEIYWDIGNTILQEQKKQGWGSKIVERFSSDLKLTFPDIKGFSVRNLKYMRAFADAYPEFNAYVQLPPVKVQAALAQNKQQKLSQIVQVPLAQITWYHHIALIDKVKTTHERLFYAKMAVENGWSRDVMVMNIESDLYNRKGKAISNFNKTIPPFESDLLIETFKNPYVFDFLTLGERAKEREIEKALIQHLKKFMLELGKGFAYVGNQFNIVVNDDDYFLDLLFYNYRLHRFVIFEIKVGDFKPEYAGKLNFYINTVDGQIKGDKDDSTIGILLCKTPNELVVHYTLKGIKTPIGVSEYMLKKGLPKVLKTDMPSIKELEAEIENEFKELKGSKK